MKTRSILLSLCLALAVSVVGQEKYGTKTGTITFEASVPSFEEVKAKNTNVSAVLDAASGKFAALALMKGFRFKVALMEEHFNENYIESSKYPKATFKGTILNFDGSSISGTEQYVIKGTLNLHGVDKSLEVPATLSATDGQMQLSAQFVLRPEEFQIKIPSVVSNKISEDVHVSVIFQLQKQ